MNQVKYSFCDQLRSDLATYQIDVATDQEEVE